ncbi:FecR family protein [Flavobacterium flevense]|uniref:Iron dicitrate transporter FecR n=1 Tax=Flavobacterium flevense TaxID=983 RepID=A0A4Y4ASG7_9FLAO|nr:FecR family protein [Flavobacterium flevense]GEC71198.1 iron dicitrate transporter FecR [Flavobacterium flevense]SHL31387.1 FecR family protein [Flavobacterium flevense]
MDSNPNLVNILKEIVYNGSVETSRIELLSQEEQELIKELQDNGMLKEALLYVESMDAEENWQELKEKIKLKKDPIVINWKNIFQYAAVFVCLLSLVYVFQYKTDNQTKTIIPDDAIQLVLENGDIQVLSPNGEQQVIKKDGAVVATQKENKISYSASDASDELVYNEIKIPYGKTFEITLSDGTQVFMNAGSSLKYPVQFIKGHHREVVLEGEAFFDVTKDKKHPFIVKTRGVDVKVLGTKFNVSSYKEDADINTVLVEGSVSLSNTGMPNNNTMLVPGEKGTWNSQKTAIAVKKVDTRIYTEWMTGEIVFRKTAFKDIIIKLERSYNVAINNNKTELLDKKFNGSFNKNIESIEEVLTAMSKIQSFSFSKEGKQITIN